MNAPAKAPDKKAVIAQALSTGGGFDAARSALLAAGVSASAADYELKRAEKDPLLTMVARLAREVAKRDWVLGIQRRLAELSTADPVPTVDEVDAEIFLQRFYAVNRPVRLTGMVDHWPALRLWSLDYFEQKLGDAPVELQGERESAADYELYKFRHRRMLPMRDVVAAIRRFDSTNEFYVTAFNDTTNKHSLAPLWDDLGEIAILAPTGGRDGFFWMGPKGTVTPLHHDLTNNLLVQLVGRKRVRLVPPWELPRVRNTVHCFSELGLDDLDSGRGDVPASLECVIGPGEALFLPVGWWHHVEALDVSVSMSYTNFPAANDFVAGHPEAPVH